MRYLCAYVAAFAVMVSLDIVWLRFAGEVFFRPAVGDMLTEKPNLIAAALFYVFFIAGLTYFSMAPALNGGGAAMAILNGAALGFLAYMSFDLTNMTVLKSWPLKVAVIDISWGTFVAGLSAAAGYWAARLGG